MAVPGGAGKSMFALELAAGIAAGVAGGDILGIGMQSHGPVLYLAGEDPESAIWHRLYNMGKLLTPNARESIADSNRLTIQSLIGERPDLMDSNWVGVRIRS